MALTNLPYDDEKIVEAARSGVVKRRELRDVRVDFLSTDLDDAAEATVSATYNWTVSAADAVRILAGAVPVSPPTGATGTAPTSAPSTAVSPSTGQ